MSENKDNAAQKRTDAFLQRLDKEARVLEDRPHGNGGITVAELKKQLEEMPPDAVVLTNMDEVLTYVNKVQAAIFIDQRGLDGEGWAECVLFAIPDFEDAVWRHPDPDAASLWSRTLNVHRRERLKQTGSE